MCLCVLSHSMFSFTAQLSFCPLYHALSSAHLLLRCTASQVENYRHTCWAEPVSAREKQTTDRLFAMLQIMLAVLARGYDWQVDLTEPIRESLCPFQGAVYP